MTRPIDLSALHAAFKRGEYGAVLDALLPAFDACASNEMALALIANSALMDNRPATAIPALERLVSLRSGHTAYQRTLSQARNRAGAAMRREKRFTEATLLFRQALAAWRDNSDALLNLALTYDDARAYEQALPVWQRLREVKPDDTEIALDHANSLALNRRIAEAQAQLRQLPPRDADSARLNLRHAEVLANADLSDDAFERLRICRIEPCQASRVYALGDRLAQASDIDAASFAYDLAARSLGNGDVSPGLRAAIAARLALPAVYRDAMDLETHRDRYERQLKALDDDFTEQGLARCEPKLEQLAWSNFYLAYQGWDDRRAQADYGRWLSRIAPMFAPGIEPAKARARRSRARIGLVASIFRSCTAGSYFASWARLLTQAGHEVHVFQLGPVFDQVTERMAHAAARLHRVAPGLNAMAAALAASECDLLIYPELGMDARLLPIAALRLAPRQACAWGHPVTPGLPTLDACFTCAEMEPADAASHYNEPLLPLPGLGTDYLQPEIPEPIPRGDLGLPETGRLYLLPHALYKLHPDNDAVFAAIAARDPSGILILFESEARGALPPFRRRLAAALREHGADPDRQLLFLPMTSRERFLQINLTCDVMVDSLHWSGGNTSLDALMCGLPVVTCPGRFMRARQSAAMLKRIGLDELIADTPDGVAQKAVAIACDAERRRDLSERIHAGLPALFDTAGLADALRTHIDRLLDA